MDTEVPNEDLAAGSVVCSICCGVFQPNQLISLSQCGCAFCRNCLKLYVLSVVQDRLDPTCACPTYACPFDGNLTDLEIQEVLSPDLYERYLTRKREREIESNATLTYCPAAGCGVVCNVTAAAVATVNPTVTSATPYLPPRLMGRVTSWYRQRSSSGSTRSSRHRIPTCFGTRIEKNPSNKSAQDPNQSGIKFISSPKSAKRGSAACPAVRVVCHQCGLIFCARCHMAWHGDEPSLCDPTLASKPNSRPRTVSFRLSEMLKSQVLPDGLVPSAPSNDPISTIGSASSHADSSTPLISHSTLSAASRSRPSQRKRPRGTQKWTSRLVLPPSTPQPSPSSHLDLSMLAVGFPPYPPNAWLKRCPACLVPIERVEGCAQMNCRACKHTFCWYCLNSLDNDFLLRHYDSGACKGKLGHSRASVIGHRVYAITVLAGLSVLLLIAAPFVIVSVPCFLCIKCQRVHLQRRLRKRHRGGLREENPSGTADVTTLSNGPLTRHKTENAGLAECRSPRSATDVPVEIVLAEKVDIHWPDISHTSGDESKAVHNPDASPTSAPDQSAPSVMNCSLYVTPENILDPT
ncbi:E3 ubiquitin-protein ligase RNF144B [Fasciola hepatica]|uniref:RBR-type E3 ubiquitin transferase n=1 Tax=Fasciola hepatica TaxID=6192 RepID=A0A4E0R1N2_FASHE|nr:E3 ubiquitin-protein ligase RNF144B [Fasciola hepatica]